jgi:hypothetical protein
MLDNDQVLSRLNLNLKIKNRFNLIYLFTIEALKVYRLI